MSATIRITIVLVHLILASAGFASDSVCKSVQENRMFKVTGSDFVFPSASTKHVYSSTGRYIPKNILATRIQIYKGEAYLAVPRYRPGVPITVAKFDVKSTKSFKAKLKPFPNWCSQEEGNCEAFQNAVDLVADGRGHLWILDLGICNTLEQSVRRCPPKLWEVEIATGEVLKVVNLKQFVDAHSRLQFLVIDFSVKGDPYAYISDAGTGSIIVVNVQLDSGFRVVLPPVVGAGRSQKDILYMQLARKQIGNVLYVSYFSSPRVFSIKTNQLQTAQTADAVIDVGHKPLGRSMVFLGTNNSTEIFFRYEAQSDIYVWNSTTPFRLLNFVLVQEREKCRFPTQVVLGGDGVVWAIESNFHDYIRNSTGCFGASMVVYPLAKSGS